MVDCLKHAVDKENEIPQLIDIIFKKISGNSQNVIQDFNQKMRSSEEILKDYGLGGA